jgi:MFS family permease
MYSESDVRSAVDAGAISAEAAEALRAHVAAQRAIPAADEEGFRLVSGFNDIFVSIACLLVVFAAAAVGSATRLDFLGGLLVAVAAWIMAEVFTRRRRMALPSIILLLALVLGLGFAASSLLEQLLPEHLIKQVDHWDGETQRFSYQVHYPWERALFVLAGAAAGGIGALVHWRRFHVAITIAAAVGALAMLVLAAVAAIRNEPIEANPLIAPAALVCGLGVFAYAMRWNTSDRTRTTQRSDIAFWLHLVAAPLIAHPLFYWMGVTRGESIGVGMTLGVMAIYLVFAVIALAIDRRALLVSALAYVLFTLAQLFDDYGAVKLSVALTALIIGSALLALSAAWATIRRNVIARLPATWRAKLPPAA